MIKKILTIGFALGTIGLNAQQINNNGFETWSGSPSTPTYWGTIDKAIANSAFGSIIGPTNFVTKSTSPYAGSFAINLTTGTAGSFGNFPAVAIYGNMTLSGTSVALTGQPYTYQPTSVSYAIKGTVISGDSVPSIVLLTHWNTNTQQRDTVGAGFDYVSSSSISSGYTVRTFPIQYVLPDVPDTMQYIISSSVVTSSPALGTSVTIDDIQFSGSMGIADVKANQVNAIAYPNPAVNEITIAYNDTKAKNVSIYDLTGRLVSKKDMQLKASFDVSAFENGMYIYVITDANNAKLYTSKFSVAK
jgi:hypothetical protein